LGSPGTVISSALPAASYRFHRDCNMGLPFLPSKDNDEQGGVREVTDTEIIDTGSLTYTHEAGENSSLPTYQEASGAPVEVKSPLGYSVGPITIIALNLSQMIGIGVFSTPSTVLQGAGSVGLAFIYWTLGYLMAFSTLAVYLEFASYFPSRSGSEVVYFEQAFPRPLYFFPTVFAMQTVILSFSSSNAVGEYTPV
jgi:amino acid permease